MALPKPLTRSFAAAAALLFTASVSAASPPDSRNYRLLRDYESAASGGNLSVDFYSALLRHQDSGEIIQCHYMKVQGAPDNVTEKKIPHPTIYVRVNEGALTLADALRPAREGFGDFGSCLPYETPLTPEQALSDGTNPFIPFPHAQTAIGFGTADEQSVAYGMDYFPDPVRERRLESQYWYEKLTRKPGSPLPMDGKISSFWGNNFIHRLSPCDNTGNMNVIEKINNSQGTVKSPANKPFASLPLRTDCPDLR